MIEVDVTNVKATPSLSNFFVSSEKGPEYVYDPETDLIGRGFIDPIYYIPEMAPIDHLPKAVQRMIEAVQNTHHAPVIHDDEDLHVQIDSLYCISREKQHIAFGEVWFLKAIGNGRYEFFAVATNMPRLLQKHLKGRPLCATGVFETEIDKDLGTVWCSAEKLVFHTRSKKAVKFIRDAGFFGYSLQAKRVNLPTTSTESKVS